MRVWLAPDLSEQLERPVKDTSVEFNPTYHLFTKCLLTYHLPDLQNRQLNRIHLHTDFMGGIYQKNPQCISHWKDHGHHVSVWLLSVHALAPCLRRADDEELLALYVRSRRIDSLS